MPGSRCSEMLFGKRSAEELRSRRRVRGGETMALTRNDGPPRSVLNHIGVGLALPVAILVIALATTGLAYAADGTDVSPHAVRAKMNYCEVCHGVSGQGFQQGFYPVPRLAGQTVDYIENELKGFADRQRSNKEAPAKTNIMFNVGHVLSPAMIKALAEKFHALNPPPLGGAPKGNLTAGKKIFEDGIPDAHVPACATCHGKDARGNGPFPRLAGQLYSYVVSQLSNWGQERAETNSQIMGPIAHKLSKSQIEAVAAYVSDLH